MNIDKLETMTVIAQTEILLLSTRLTAQNIQIIELKGQSIVDQKSFLKQSALDLPQPASTSPPQKLSAFVDNLWQGVYQQKNTEIAVLWSHAEKIVQHNLNDFLRLTQLFTDLARDLSQASQPRTLYLIVAGEGSGFAQQIQGHL